MATTTKVCKIPGKGLGLVASKDISPGGLILKEPPLVKVQLDPGGDLAGYHYQPNSASSVKEFVVPSLIQGQLDYSGPGSLKKGKFFYVHSSSLNNL